MSRRKTRETVPGSAAPHLSAIQEFRVLDSRGNLVFGTVHSLDDAREQLTILQEATYGDPKGYIESRVLTPWMRV